MTSLSDSPSAIGRLLPSAAPVSTSDFARQWDAAIGRIVRYGVADRHNPLCRSRAGAMSRRGTRFWMCAAAAASGASALAYLLFDLEAAVQRHIGSLIGVLLLVSYVLPVYRTRRTFERLKSSGKLEPLVLTELTDGELARGMVLPGLARFYPPMALAGLLLIVWPLAAGGFDMTRRLLFFSLFCNIAANFILISWIALRLIVGRIERAHFALAIGALILLDPYLLVWTQKLIHSEPSWRPLVFALAFVELTYCAVKAKWAYLAVDELKGGLRRFLAD